MSIAEDRRQPHRKRSARRKPLYRRQPHRKPLAGREPLYRRPDDHIEHIRRFDDAVVKVFFRWVAIVVFVVIAVVAVLAT